MGTYWYINLKIGLLWFAVGGNCSNPVTQNMLNALDSNINTYVMAKESSADYTFFQVIFWLYLTIQFHQIIKFKQPQQNK